MIRADEIEAAWIDEDLAMVLVEDRDIPIGWPNHSASIRRATKKHSGFGTAATTNLVWHNRPDETRRATLRRRSPLAGLLLCMSPQLGTQQPRHPSAVPGLLSDHSCRRQRQAGRSVALDPERTSPS